MRGLSEEVKKIGVKDPLFVHANAPIRAQNAIEYRKVPTAAATIGIVAMALP